MVQGLLTPKTSRRFLVLLVVVDFREFAIDNISFLGSRGVITTRSTGAFLLRLVHRFTEFHRSLCQRIGLGADRVGVITLEGFLKIGHRILDRPPFVLSDLGAVLGKRLFGRVHQRFGVVLGFTRGLAFLVFLGVSLSILYHLLDVGF